MTAGPTTPDSEKLTFRHFSGALVDAVATIEGEEHQAGDFLTTRDIRLEDGTEFRQVRVADGPRRVTGYERLDNEILAGRRLHDVSRSSEYPASVSFLYGDEAISAAPYALLKHYKGLPLSEVAGQMLPDEQRDFEVSLLGGLCWLAAAGIAHRGLSPSTVHWDSGEREAQITDFSMCTVFGAPRRSTGPPQPVTNRDDMYAAGLLIYYVRTQGDDGQPSPGKLAEMGLGPLAGPPEHRPTAAELLAAHYGEADPVPRGAGGAARLADGYSRFEFWWEKKGAGRSFPVDPRDGGVGSPHHKPPPKPPTPPPPLPPQPRQGATQRDRRRGWRRSD